MKREIKTGDVVKHFKFETISKEEHEVNKEKYPNIYQKYRFELMNE